MIQILGSKQRQRNYIETHRFLPNAAHELGRREAEALELSKRVDQVLLHVYCMLSGTYASHQNQIPGFGHAIWTSKKL